MRSEKHMSDVYCKDCDSSAGFESFESANRENKLMRELVKLGPQLKRLCVEMIPIVALVGDSRFCRLGILPTIVLSPGKSSQMSLHETWWVRHGDHKLVVRA